MKRPIATFALALATLPLTACYEGGYGVGMGWHSYPYDVWYDGYYGPLYDGYWGLDGFFYYRLNGSDARYRRDDRHHFYRGDSPPRPNYRRYQGQTHEPPRGARMPSYPPPSSDMRQQRNRRNWGDQRQGRDQRDRSQRQNQRDRGDQH